MNDDSTIPCYTAKCLCGCGGLVYADVDEPNKTKERKKGTANEIAKMIRRGYAIERMTVGDVRKASFGCQKD